MDVIGSVDIANGLQAEAVIEKAVEGETETTTLEGDSWKISTSSNTLEISENFDQILSKVGSGQLDALASDEVDTTVGGTAKYDQYIVLEDGVVNFYKNTASGHGAKGVGMYLYYANKGKFLNYSMIFSDAWDATLATTTTADVTYFEEDQLNILGQPWTVVDATRPQTVREDSLKMILIGGGVPITMQTGDEAQTVEVDGVEHEVGVSSIYSTKAYVSIDGTTKDINSGEIQAVGGLLVGITSISTSSKETVADTVKFVVGGQRLEMRDNEIQDNQASSHKLKVGSGGSNVPNSELIIRGTDDNSTLTVTEIDINLVTDRSYYLDGEEFTSLAGVVHNSYLQQALEALDIDLVYEGLTDPDTYEVSLSGGDTYTLSYEDLEGNAVDVPIAYKATSATNLSWGDSSNLLLLTPDDGRNISVENMFILTDDAAKADGKTEILTYTSYSFDSDTNTLSIDLEPKVGDTYKVSMTASSGFLTGPLVVNGVSYTVKNWSDPSGTDPLIAVTRDSGTIVTDQIIAKGGLKIQLINNATTSEPGIPGQIKFHLAQAEQLVDGSSSFNTNALSGITALTFNLTAPVSTDTYAQIARGSPTSGTWKQRTGESNTYRYINEYGIEGVFESPSGASQTFGLTVPVSQRVPEVFLTSGATTSSTSTSGGTTTQEIVPINVGAAKLDTEIIDEFGSDFASKVNVIAIGGPRANSVAASLLGNPDSEAINAMFKPGESVIKLFENGEKVSMLVAGWEAPDTKKACEIVAKHLETDGFEGDDIRVKTVDGSVTAVEEAAEEEVVEEEAEE